MKSAIAIIVAAGKGSRMQESIPKQYLEIHNKPILYHTILKFYLNPLISKIIAVIPSNDDKYYINNIISSIYKSLNNKKILKKIEIVKGGSTRQNSVFNALKKINNTQNIVLIHDGVRPFVKQIHITKCIQTAVKYKASILAIPASDTIKKAEQNEIFETLDRTNLWLAQTPQAFDYSLILNAHKNAQDKGFDATDDSMLVEKIGQRVHIVKGDNLNIKITTKEDLIIAKQLFSIFYQDDL